MSKLTVTNGGLNLSVTAKYGARADSRNIAEALGINHRSMIRLIDKHQQAIEEVERIANPENQFHQVRFQITVGKRKQGGGNPERYALLTENQCYFLGTLSKNTARVVAFKARLVIAFAEARKLQQAHDGQYIPFRYLCHDAARAMHRQAASNGSNTSESVYHMNIETMINKAFGIQKGTRQDLPADAKAAMGSAYQIAEAAITQVLSNGGNSSAAYQEAKRRVNDFVRLFGRPILGGAA